MKIHENSKYLEVQTNLFHVFLIEYFLYKHILEF